MSGTLNPARKWFLVLKASYLVLPITYWDFNGAGTTSNPLEETPTVTMGRAG